MIKESRQEIRVKVAAISAMSRATAHDAVLLKLTVSLGEAMLAKMRNA